MLDRAEWKFACSLRSCDGLMMGNTAKAVRHPETLGTRSTNWGLRWIHLEQSLLPEHLMHDRVNREEDEDCLAMSAHFPLS